MRRFLFFRVPLATIIEGVLYDGVVVFRMYIALFAALVLIASCAMPGRGPDEPHAFASDDTPIGRLMLVREIRRHEAAIGWRATENFLSFGEATEIFRTCYYTGRFDLELDFDYPAGQCTKDPARYDSWLYEMEAAAFIKAPILPKLAAAPRARFLMVVFHEDFHEQIPGIPSWALNESATTLLGLLAARDFAERRYGADSEVFRALTHDLDSYLESSLVLIQYSRALASLYARVKKGELTEDEARSEKSAMFVMLGEQCKRFRLHTLASCAVATNNARLAFGLAYTRYYPLFFRLYNACGNDTKRTSDVIVALSAARLDEAYFIAQVEKMIGKHCTP